MSAVWTTTRVRQEIDRLADWRSRLTAALTHGASQLEAIGLVPDDELLADLSDYRQRMRTLALQITGRVVAPEERLSLARLEEQLQKSQHREELIRQLDGIADLEHVDDAEYAPLEKCRADAQRCQQRLASVLEADDEEQGRLLAHEHPLQAVLQLIRIDADLSDNEWSRLQDRVVRRYGRTLGAALARGKIRPRSSTVISPDELPSIRALTGSDICPAVALVPTPEAPAVSTPSGMNVTDDEGDPATRWFKPGSSILPGVNKSTTPVKDMQESSAATTAETAATESIPSIVIDLDLPKPVWHNHPAAKLAREIAAENPRSVPRLSALVRQLLRDDRVALAANLARCAERLPSGRGMAPSSGLLRALALGKSLSYARGELSRAVDMELKPLVSGIAAAATNDDEMLGLGFLLRAAALLPALLGASASAASVLRSFTIEPGLSHLYNYCSRVAAFGERLQSQAVELFQAPAEQTRWQAEHKLLETEVRDWLARAAKRGVSYQRSSPLFLHAHWTVMASPTQRHPHAAMEWARWQEVLLLAQRMLMPMIDGTAQRQDVRSELARATALVQLEAGDAAESKPTRAGIPLTESMQEVLLEAIDLANRWLRLQSATSQRGLHLAPHQAEELRTELLERSGGVLAELDVISRTRTADIVQTGVCCCRRAVEHIRRLCAGEVPLALHEPDAKHVLYGEFLMMPHIELDENWQPTEEPTEQEQALLEHISVGWTDWSSAFALQCHQEDHLATTRLLEMSIWPDPQMLNALHRARGEELQRSRQAVQRELDELASQITLNPVDRPDLDLPRVEMQERLERLRVAIPKVLAFGPIRRRLERYRQRWQRFVVEGVNPMERHTALAEGDSGVLPALSAAVSAAETEAETKPSTEQWVFLEE